MQLCRYSGWISPFSYTEADAFVRVPSRTPDTTSPTIVRNPRQDFYLFYPFSSFTILYLIIPLFYIFISCYSHHVPWGLFTLSFFSFLQLFFSLEDWRAENRENETRGQVRIWLMQSRMLRSHFPCASIVCNVTSTYFDPPGDTPTGAFLKGTRIGKWNGPRRSSAASQLTRNNIHYSDSVTSIGRLLNRIHSIVWTRFCHKDFRAIP